MKPSNSGPEVPKQTKLTYLRRRLVDMEKCREAIAQADFTSVSELAHRMKGNGSTFGFPEISALAGQLERESEGGEPRSASQSLARLSQVIEKELNELEALD